MPELPEVETVVRGLRSIALGRSIAAVTVRAPRNSWHVSRRFGKASLATLLAGRRIEAIVRRGKNILMALSGGATLWVHLKMTGRFFHLDKSAPLDRHDLFLFDFEDPGKSPLHLRFNDYRRFGRLRLCATDELWQQKGLGDLGPEPLEMTARQFVTLCHGARRMIKPALLDQTFVAGVGNIYADEMLWAGRVHPMRSTDSLSPAKLTELHGHMQRLLLAAIDKMGTSSDTFTGVNGQPGKFQKYLMVYDREGEPCRRCEAYIVRGRISSRSAHFCPRCQRLR